MKTNNEQKELWIKKFNEAWEHTTCPLQQRNIDTEGTQSILCKIPIKLLRNKIGYIPCPLQEKEECIHYLKMFGTPMQMIKILSTEISEIAYGLEPEEEEENENTN